MGTKQVTSDRAASGAANAFQDSASSSPRWEKPAAAALANRFSSRVWIFKSLRLAGDWRRIEKDRAAELSEKELTLHRDRIDRFYQLLGELMEQGRPAVLERFDWFFARERGWDRDKLFSELTSMVISLEASSDLREGRTWFLPYLEHCVLELCFAKILLPLKDSLIPAHRLGTSDEDVFQEKLAVKFREAIEDYKYDPNRATSGWGGYLYRIMSRKCRDAHSKADRRGEISLEAQWDESNPESSLRNRLPSSATTSRWTGALPGLVEMLELLSRVCSPLEFALVVYGIGDYGSEKEGLGPKVGITADQEAALVALRYVSLRSAIRRFWFKVGRTSLLTPAVLERIRRPIEEKLDHPVEGLEGTRVRLMGETCLDHWLITEAVLEKEKANRPKAAWEVRKAKISGWTSRAIKKIKAEVNVFDHILYLLEVHEYDIAVVVAFLLYGGKHSVSDVETLRKRLHGEGAQRLDGLAAATWKKLELRSGTTAARMRETKAAYDAAGNGLPVELRAATLRSLVDQGGNEWLAEVLAACNRRDDVADTLQVLNENVSPLVSIPAAFAALCPQECARHGGLTEALFWLQDRPLQEIVEHIHDVVESRWVMDSTRLSRIFSLLYRNLKSRLEEVELGAKGQDGFRTLDWTAYPMELWGLRLSTARLGDLFEPEAGEFDEDVEDPLYAGCPERERDWFYDVKSAAEKLGNELRELGLQQGSVSHV